MHHRTLILKPSFIVALLLGAHSAQSQHFDHTEMLFRPEAHQITVQLFPSYPMELCAVFGVDSLNLNQHSDTLLALPHEPAALVLGNLIAGTKYYYQLHFRALDSTLWNNRSVYHFKTAPDLGSSFKFVVQADPHLDEQSDTAVYTRCLQNQADDQPDFRVDLGDFLMTDKLKDSTNHVPEDTIPFRCHLLRSYYEKSGHSIPLFLVLGNHEGEAGWLQTPNGNNMAVWDTRERKKYFMNPEPDAFYSGDTTTYPFTGRRQSYYSWQWGDALFVVIDPYWFTTVKPDSAHGWRWTLGEAQYVWLKNTLENCTASYKFVFSHQLVGGDAEGRGGTEFADWYEWGGLNADGTDGFAANRPGWYAPIRQVLEENKVRIFFHGHDHFFGKQEKNCLIYQECPQPSHPNFQNVNYAADYGYSEGIILPNSGHIRVNVSPDGILVEYVRVYKPESENPSRHNKDVSASYFIPNISCYDSLITAIPMLWRDEDADQIIYPNPSSDFTCIRFTAKESAHYSLQIFDLTGRPVRTLMPDRPVNQGNYELFWDGNSYRGTQVPAGIYKTQLLKNGILLESGTLIRKD